MRLGSMVCLLAFAASLIGCAGAELTPIVPAGSVYVNDQNPVYIPLGRESYGTVYENVLQVLGDYGFQIDQT